MLHLSIDKYQIEFGLIEDSSFGNLLQKFEGRNKVIIVDENTNACCLPRLIGQFDALCNAEIIVLPVGEETKDIEIATSVWDALSDYSVSRHDLIINLGGGVITDFGGFVASCYKRGVAFVNIPTSLLAMVDASIGGKTGINLGKFKNQIGVFANPHVVYIDPTFLETLPNEELRSGFAEMLKHGILISEEEFDRVLTFLKQGKVDSELLLSSINCKKEIVERDFRETGDRKLLNLGHTFGHAIEGVFIEQSSFKHGDCVAFGIMVESIISNQIGELTDAVCTKIVESLMMYYPFPKLSSDDLAKVVALLHNDKKNKDGKILSCLIKDFGKCVYDQEVTEEQVKRAVHKIVNSSTL